MYTKPHKNSDAFTLIEILSVIVIIMVLAGITVPIVSSARTSAKKGVTSAQIAQLELALKQFESDFGVFPPDSYISTDTPISLGGIDIPVDPEDDIGTGTKCLVFFLGSRFTFDSDDFKGVYGPYIEFKKSQLEGTGVDFADDPAELIIEGVKAREVFQLKDPFGEYYIYDSSSPSNNIASFDIYSFGPDKIDDSGDPANDDITNW
jgi:type II secretory pathway pseudopilin PulG